MIIALDAYGCDNAPHPEIEGAVLAVKELLCDKVLLFGDEKVISDELKKYYFKREKIEVVHSTQKIEMSESASSAARTKKESSIVKAMVYHKEGKVDAVVSAGNTGAVMAAALFHLGRIKNIIRPAIAITFPTKENYEIILDVGANVDCEPEHLFQFAVLGAFYSRLLLKIDNPRVSLLNIGEESVKGNKLMKETYKILEKNDSLNFIGNIEGKDLLKGVTDVVVCDGFVGNIMLKTVEGTFISMFEIMKEQFRQDWVAKIGALLSYPVYAYLKKKLDHSEYGGALLLGLNGVPVVAHGRSNGVAIKNAIRIAAKIAGSGLINEAVSFFTKDGGYVSKV